MMYLDSHPDVISWSSEELAIPYRSPIDNKIHRYFPDFIVKKKNPHGVVECLMIEVKPLNQVNPPLQKSKSSRKFINEVKTYGVNSAKWKAAKEYCELKKWKFLIMTEKELGILWKNSFSRLF